MSITTLSIAWLGGLLEGEGSFIDGVSPEISLQSTDKDIVEKAAKLMGVDLQAPWTPKGKESYKPVHVIRIHGSKAICWMMTLYVFLGERRSKKVREILIGWRASPRIPRAPRGQRWAATCHPDKLRTGRGLCKNCYMQEYRKAKKLGISLKRFYEEGYKV